MTLENYIVGKQGAPPAKNAKETGLLDRFGNPIYKTTEEPSKSDPASEVVSAKDLKDKFEPIIEVKKSSQPAQAPQVKLDEADLALQRRINNLQKQKGLNEKLLRGGDLEKTNLAIDADIAELQKRFLKTTVPAEEKKEDWAQNWTEGYDELTSISKEPAPTIIKTSDVPDQDRMAVLKKIVDDRLAELDTSPEANKKRQKIIDDRLAEINKNKKLEYIPYEIVEDQPPTPKEIEDFVKTTVIPQLPPVMQEELNITEKPKSFWDNVQSVVPKKSFLGKTYWKEILMGAGAGVAVGALVRTFVAKMTLGASVVGGGVAGGVSAAVKYRFEEGRKYKEFISEVTEENKKFLTLEDIAIGIEKLKARQAQEPDKKRKEVIGDQIRYLMIRAKRMAKENDVSPTALVGMLITARQEGAGMGNSDRKAFEKEVKGAGFMKGKETLKRVLIGAATGAAMGGLFHYFFSPTPVAPVSHVTPPPVVPLAPPVAPPPTGFTHALKPGENLWSFTKDLLTSRGLPADDMSVMALDRAISTASTVEVPAWDIAGNALHTALEVGHKVVVTPDIITKFHL